MNADFIWRMESILDLYEQDYNPKYPVISFDERPCQLIDDIISPKLPRPGEIKKEDYQYKKRGTCCVLMAIEPLTGKRFTEVRETRTKKDYQEFFKKLADSYPDAKKITVIQDNLNTHNPSSFYKNMDAKDAFALMSRFHMAYTPKKASWLNLIEIEFSALSKQCLDRRIGDIDRLKKEVLTWAQKRERDEVTISWQFTKDKARNKLGRHYELVKN